MNKPQMKIEEECKGWMCYIPPKAELSPQLKKEIVDTEQPFPILESVIRQKHILVNLIELSRLTNKNT